MKIHLLSLATLALHSAPIAAQRATATYVAPTDQTVFTHTEESAGSVPGHVIWINNRSSVPIVVYSASLRSCENIKQSCSPTRLNLRVRPAGRAILLRVQAKNPMEGFRYSLSFGYRADSSNIAAMRVLAEAGSSEAQARIDANAEAEAERRRTVGASDIFLDEESIAALGPRFARVVAVPDSLVVRTGRAFLLRDVKLMAVDSGGNLLGRVVTGVRWSLPQFSVLVNSADTLQATEVGRTVIRFTVRAGTRTLEATFPVIVVDEPPPLLSSGARGGSVDSRGRRAARRWSRHDQHPAWSGVPAQLDRDPATRLSGADVADAIDSGTGARGTLRR